MLFFCTLTSLKEYDWLCTISGAAVGVSLSPEQAQLCMVEDMTDKLSPLACAYARARGKYLEWLVLIIHVSFLLSMAVLGIHACNLCRILSDSLDLHPLIFDIQIYMILLCPNSFMNTVSKAEIICACTFWHLRDCLCHIKDESL